MAEDKIYKYRGKTLEELQALSFEQFCELLPSDLRRKVKRGLTSQEELLLKKIQDGEKNIKTHARDMFVIPSMVGQKIGVHNGKEFVLIVLVDEMIGHRFGELAMTRKIAAHTSVGAKKTVTRK